MLTRKKWTLLVSVLGFGLAVLVFMAARSQPLGAAGWSIPENASQTLGSSYIPGFAVDPQDNLYVVWQDWVDLSAHMPYVLYASKSPGGNWSDFNYLPGKETCCIPS